MRSLIGPLLGLAGILAAHAATAAPMAPSRHEVAAGDAMIQKTGAVLHYSDVRHSDVYYGVHYVPWVQARRHWYQRYYQPAYVEPFKYYPYYFYTPRYIYTPHYAIKRSHYRRARR